MSWSQLNRISSSFSWRRGYSHNRFELNKQNIWTWTTEKKILKFDPKPKFSDNSSETNLLSVQCASKIKRNARSMKNVSNQMVKSKKYRICNAMRCDAMEFDVGKSSKKWKMYRIKMVLIELFRQDLKLLLAFRDGKGPSFDINSSQR